MNWAPFYMVIAHVWLAAAAIVWLAAAPISGKWFFPFVMGIFYFALFMFCDRKEREDK